MDIAEYRQKAERCAYCPQRRTLREEWEYSPDFDECQARAREAHSVIVVMAVYDQVVEFSEILHRILKTHKVYVRSRRDPRERTSVRKHLSVKNIHEIRTLAKGGYPALVFVLPKEISPLDAQRLIESEFPDEPPWYTRTSVRKHLSCFTHVNLWKRKPAGPNLSS
jgi:hypothetical protein